MTHLSKETLSAHLDRALTGGAAEAAERHLAGCESCRAALAALAAQDAALRPALTHDPGEAYFESFAARVEERLRAGAPAGAARRGLGLGRWLGSPRALAWAGGAAVVVVGGGIALLTSREVRPPDLRDRNATFRVEQPAAGEARRDAKEAGDRAAEPSPPPLASAPAEPAGPVAQSLPPGLPGTAAPAGEDDAAKSARLDDVAASPPAGAWAPAADARITSREARAASPGRAHEVRRNESGEEVPVRRPGFAAPPPPPAPPQGKDENQIRKQQAAQPLGQTAPPAVSLAPDVAERETAAGTTSGLAPPAGRAGKLLAGRAGEAEPRLCGEVRDASGRPIAGAQVVLSDLGRTTRTDARGGFCLGAPGGEHRLSVMAVGFAESRQTVRVGGGERPVRVTLAVVPVLEGPPVAGRRPSPGASTPAAERQDGYAALPESLRAVVRAAQDLEATARLRRSASLYDAAAAGWERALGALVGGPLELETRWHVAETRFRAWEALASARRAAAAEAALAAYTLRAPAGPERDRATAWLERVRR